MKQFNCYIQEGPNVFTLVVIIKAASKRDCVRIIKERMADRNVCTEGYDRICAIQEAQACRDCCSFGAELKESPYKDGRRWYSCTLQLPHMKFFSGSFEFTQIARDVAEDSCGCFHFRRRANR